MLVDPDTSGALQAVNAEAFLGDLFHPKSADSVAAFVALRDAGPSEVLLAAPAALTEREALRVRKWAEAKLAVEGDGDADSVDEAPTFQVSLDWPTLESLVGVEGGKRLTGLAMPFLKRSAVAEDAGPIDDLLLSISVIVRKYTPGERPFIGFHVDNNDATVNVALSAPSNYEGGRFLALVGGELRDATSDKAGDAVVHSWNVCHAVTAVRSGERWSLVLFLSNSWPPNHAGFFQKLRE